LRYFCQGNENDISRKTRLKFEGSRFGDKN